ncbi:MAG: enoyl-CoA hydratase/isomerase family protein [Candidatus Tectomicrobia bacterium]|uniref:Enoyl-CoA hydratase/isomerase family protein n=1 Tax=Tectimicrobiota bacterium TaxID=2528274 RepID=A0A932GS66_UNCTE|nr:enoyl-CoA hydratase/isomerase family protein [Candidatus Tectomicrobia bacterium]
MGYFEPRPAESFEFKEIIYEKKDWVARVTINRPHAYNAYSTLTLFEMTQAFLDASWDDGIAVVVLTGAGDKAFCTGGDVKEYESVFTKKPRDYWKWMGAFVQAHDTFRNIGKPTIARINGMVAGGGNEWNLSADLAVCADHATIRQVGTRVGSVACGGASQFLPIVIGDRRAREMLFTCDPITAQQALEWGLVNKVVPYADLDKAVDELCQKLINKFPECTRYTKQQVNFWKDFVWNLTIGHAKDWLSLHYMAIEPYEGMKAFVEKRQPDYLGVRRLAAEGKSSEFLWGPYVHTCSKCGAKGIPESFSYCGQCGAKL